MRYFLASLLAAAALVALPIKADIAPTDLAATNAVNASVTLTTCTGNALKIDKQDNCGLTMSFTANIAAETTNGVTLTFKRSLDNSVWETIPTFTWFVPANGLTKVVGYTNLSTATIGGVGYFKISSIVSGCAVANCTNFVVKVIKKTIKKAP